MYTSYYPVTYYFYPLLELELKNHSGEQPFLDTWTRSAPIGVETLLYVHIPYCQDLCRFCPFHVRVEKDFSVYERYTQALCNDIRQMAASERGMSSRIGAIYFGGGSPSVLSAEQLGRVFFVIRESFQICDQAEISFEGDPKSLGDIEKLELLRSKGVNRLSFGLQTYNERLRDIFNIAASLKDVETVTQRARDLCFDEINVDMMFNLPGQTLAHVEEDVDRAVRDGYDSVDYYNLHYYAFPAKFRREMDMGKIPPKPSEGVMLALFDQLRYRLGTAGYSNVADQIYSKKGVICEYFRLLWGGGNGEHRAETLAVGSSARGYIDGIAYMNYGNVNKYMDAIEKDECPVEKVSNRLLYPENRGAVMFPKFLCIDKKHSSALNTIPPHLMQNWLDHGLLYETETAFRISERGKVWSNNMTTDLFEFAQREAGNKAVIALSEKAGSRTGSF